MVSKGEEYGIDWPGVLVHLREGKRMRQADVARAIDVAPSLLHRYELGSRRPTPAQAARLESLLALGEQDACEERPSYVVAVLTPDGTFRIPLLPGRTARAFERRDMVAVVANLLRTSGLPVYVVPSWLNHPVRAVIEREVARRGERAFGLDVDLVVVDEPRDENELAASLADYALKVIPAVKLICVEHEVRRREKLSRGSQVAPAPSLRGGDGGDTG